MAIMIPAIITVLMDNRQPAKTMAWILVLAFMPFVGIIFYIFFGQNTRKERLISDRSMDQLTKRSMLEFAEQENLPITSSRFFCKYGNILLPGVLTAVPSAMVLTLGRVVTLPFFKDTCMQLAPAGSTPMTPELFAHDLTSGHCAW